MNLVQKLASAHLQKLANSFTYRKEVVSVMTIAGPKDVPAMVLNNWAIHKTQGGRGWTITFLPMGRSLIQDVRTQDLVQRFLEDLITAIPSLLRAESMDDLTPHSSKIRNMIEEYHFTAVKSRGPSVSVLRSVLINKLKEMGLREMGERSGKAGTFYMWGHETPAWAISVGNRDIMLNEFQLDRRLNKGYEVWGGAWRMNDAELISKIPPEKLEKWVNWLKRAPTRKQLQDEKGRR